RRRQRHRGGRPPLRWRSPDLDKPAYRQGRSMIQLLLMRHAPTSWNADRRIQGRSDIPLSPEGAAEAAGWRLPEDTASWPCVSSPLARARQTAEAMGRAPVANADLIE